MNRPDGCEFVHRPPPSAPPNRRHGHLTIRRILLLGFGLIFVLWALSAYELIARLRGIETQTGSLNVRLTTAEDLLATIRTQMLLGSVYLRDALQESEPGAMQSAAAELQATRARVERALGQYAGLVDSPVEQRMFARLRGEIDSYWRAAVPGLAWDAGRRAAQSQALLRQVFIPKRELIFQVSESVQALKREAVAQRQLDTVQVYCVIQRRLAVTSALALLLSAGAATLVLVYTGRLERRIREQQARDAHNASDLQRLSARLVEAQEEERRAVARELHDEVGQALTAIKMELSHAERASGPERAVGPLDGAKTATDRALHAVRDLTRLLHPRILDELGLVAALDAYVREFSRRTGVRTELVHDGIAGSVDARLALPAYRIAQEALTNVARHAAATCCRVSLGCAADTIRISVEDDGRGFDPGAVAAGGSGVGLLGIQERVAGCGGRYRLDTGPGKGTCLTVDLPARRKPPVRQPDCASDGTGILRTREPSDEGVEGR